MKAFGRRCTIGDGEVDISSDRGDRSDSPILSLTMGFTERQSPVGIWVGTVTTAENTRWSESHTDNPQFHGC